MTNAAKKIEFDASNQSMGRLASVVAVILRGKRTVSFKPNQNPNIKIMVINIEKLRFSGNKLLTKRYYKYSGYPGGLKTTTLEQQFKKDPVRLFKRAVQHMLPKNRLSANLMKNLTVYRGIK
ncbi:MAG: 50S ribosomal protein L13 [Patescibacteria group bacterium]